MLRKSAFVHYETIGNGVDTVFVITTTDIDTSNCVVEVSEDSTKVIVAPKIEKDHDAAGDKVRITFDASDVPTASQYKVIIIGLR